MFESLFNQLLQTIFNLCAIGDLTLSSLQIIRLNQSQFWKLISTQLSYILRAFVNLYVSRETNIIQRATTPASNANPELWNNITKGAGNECKYQPQVISHLRKDYQNLPNDDNSKIVTSLSQMIKTFEIDIQIQEWM